MAEVTLENLVASIALIQFSDRKKRKLLQKDTQFFQSLKEFRQRQLALKVKTVADGTIRGWLREDKPSTPKQPIAWQFLHDYLLWINEKFPNRSAERQVLYDDVIVFLEGLLSLPERGENSRTVRLRCSRLLAISGVYQIFRPYVSIKDREMLPSYVLEPMIISEPDNFGVSILNTYSYHRKTEDYIYSGPVFASTSYCFSLAKRKHERSDEDFAFRSISGYINLQSRPTTKTDFAEILCFYGVLTRGVRGNQGLRGPVGVPFFAIKIIDDIVSLKSPDLVNIKSYLQRFSENSCVLIGEIYKNSDTEIVEFCDTVFNKVKYFLETNKDELYESDTGKRDKAKDIIMCVDPDNLARAIKTNSKNDVSCLDVWRKTIDNYLSAL